MDTFTVAVISFTLALVVGIVGAAMIDAKVQTAGANSVTMSDRGARLMMRTCPLALIAAMFITLGAMLANG